MEKHWAIRESLSRANRLRRSYYEMLRDELDQFMIQYSLLDSYRNFISKNIRYPFVEKRELKPRARIADVEYDEQNAFLVIFVEDVIPEIHKKYIRFFDVNKTIKKNILRSKALDLSDNFDRSHKYFDSVHFTDFLQTLLPVDYALLIQRDSVESRARDRYCLTHFHVRVDWPIADAAEDLAKILRYISKELFEKGDKYAEDIQKKLFEYYGTPVMAGGRRTAAVVAAQYLRRIPCISTIYAGSSESRALIRISERGVSKTVLLKLSRKNISELAEANGMAQRTFYKNYVAFKRRTYGVCLFQVAYSPTTHAKPPEDGKLREMKPDLHWITVEAQYILPKPEVWKYPPLPLNFIYS